MATARPQIWGVLNVTPDSFSDGGQFLDPQQAVDRGAQMVVDGADVVDVGAESTRPGAERVSAETELHRLEPVVRDLLERGIRVSVDTMRADVAARAISWGAPIINDVSGGKADPLMHQVVADSSADYVLMHWRGHSDQMDSLAVYDDVVAEVSSELREQIDRAIDAGIGQERIILDPGIGFAKTPEHNWELIAHIDRLVDMGYPVLVGASRKRFLGQLLPEGHDLAQRDGVSAVLSALLAERKVSALRVHEPAVHRHALDVWSHAQIGGGP